MPQYTDQVQRANVPVSEETVNQVIADIAHDSVIAGNAIRATMSKKVRRQPVTQTLPSAYWVDGDSGLKQTSAVAWGSAMLTAEELAVLVPVPDALLEDSDIPIWSEVQPLVSQAIGRAIDAAALFGTGKPSSWPAGIVPAAKTAGNSVAAGSDITKAVAQAAQKVSEDGFSVSGFVSGPGATWELIGLRGSAGYPIYSPSVADGQPSTLYGYPVNELLNGAFDASAAKIIAVDWTKVILGIRRDVTFDWFDQMVITDANGKVVYNAAQQDGHVLRASFRAGFAVANPATGAGSGNSAQRYPAAVVTPA